jgi:hypothetical protein
MSTERLLSRKEAAALLHVSLWKLDQLINRGAIAVVPIDGRVKIRPAAVSDFIGSRERRLSQAAPDQDATGKTCPRE